MNIHLISEISLFQATDPFSYRWDILKRFSICDITIMMNYLQYKYCTESFFFTHYIIIFHIFVYLFMVVLWKNLFSYTGTITSICKVHVYFCTNVKILVYEYIYFIFQKLLNDNGTVIWVEPSGYSFISGDIKPLLRRAQETGIIAWTSKDPVSTITYDKMYKYFKASAEQYYFLETAYTNQLILHNSENLHNKVMLPWVKCALSSDCINPVGASNTGCTDRKPLYLYRGCHKYDVAALNIILGQVFDYDESRYKTKEKLFGILEEKKSTIPGNMTSPMPHMVSLSKTSSHVLSQHLSFILTCLYMCMYV